jgi:hypothetical protein
MFPHEIRVTKGDEKVEIRNMVHHNLGGISVWHGLTPKKVEVFLWAQVLKGRQLRYLREAHELVISRYPEIT